MILISVVCYCLLCFTGPGLCQIWGDPHYLTFDNRRYDFQGECDYTLVRDCSNSSSPHLPSFHLTAENVRRKPSAKVTYNDEIRLDYNGTLFALMQELEVRVDGVTYVPPVYYPSGVTVLSTGLYIVSREMANTLDFFVTLDSN